MTTILLSCRKIIVIISVIVFWKSIYANDQLILRDDFYKYKKSDIGNIPAGGLRVMWWNTDCTSDKKLPQDSNPESLFQNLRWLMKSKIKPDVLILGESCPQNFDQKTYEILMQSYSEQKIDAYYSIKLSHLLSKGVDALAAKESVAGASCKAQKKNAIFRNGIRVFTSKQVKASVGWLPEGDFTRIDMMNQCSTNKKYMSEGTVTSRKKSARWSCEQDLLESYSMKYGLESFLKKPFVKGFWSRRYVRLSLNISGSNFHIVAAHLAQPWNLISRCSDIAQAADSILNDDSNNPNILQVKRLVELHQKISSQADGVLTIGDMNTPKSLNMLGTAPQYNISGPRGRGYAYFVEHLGESISSNSMSTYIHPEDSFSGKAKSAIIDHAFLTGKHQAKFASPLPLAGSTHLPIYVVIGTSNLVDTDQN